MNLSEQIGVYTPTPDALVQKYGIAIAYCWGVIWRFSQGKNGACTASIKTIAERANVSVRSATSYVKTLVDDGFVEDLTPDIKHKPHKLCTKAGQVKITGMQNLHTSQGDEDEGMQNLQGGYAKNADRGMQNLQSKKSSKEDLKDNPTTTTACEEPEPVPETTPAGKIATHYQNASGNAPRGITEAQRWEDDCLQILDMANDDVSYANALVDEAIAVLKDLGYTHKGPGALIVTISRQLQQAKRKPKGAKNGQGRIKQGKRGATPKAGTFGYRPIEENRDGGAIGSGNGGKDIHPEPEGRQASAAAGNGADQRTRSVRARAYQPI